MKKADNFNPGKWLVENKITFQSNLNEIEYMPDTDYEDNWEKGGGLDDEEFDFYSATIKDLPFPDAKGNDRMIPTLVVDETGDEFQEFYILNTPEDEENLKNDQEMGREIEGVFKVKMDNGEIKTAVVYPPTKSKSEFAGKLNEDNENKEFNIDFPSLDYNTVVDFIENKGYDIVSDYYDKGFDADEGDTFVGIFDDHIEVMDPNGRVKKYRYTK